MNARKNHHYVSQSYLKAWSNNHHKVWAYRVLVSHQSVPEWTQSSIKSIANHQNLFTRSMEGQDSDEIEIWMDQQIETPAQIALLKARSGEQLDQHDLHKLLRFVALHSIRSPAFYMENMPRWQLEMPTLLNDVLQSTVEKLQQSEGIGSSQVSDIHGDSLLIPLKVSKEISEESEWGHLKAELLLGRGIWLFTIRHILSSTYQVLTEHTWSILEAPKGLEWLTSDNPTIRLNYYDTDSYDFKGGWGNKGSEVVFPLSPRFLLYTQVGNHENISGIAPRELYIMLNRFIVENAHRYIFASNSVKDVSKIRPRNVNKEIFDQEKQEWESWHARQKELEQEYQKNKEG
ncbi:DUF4238 domain-containing protein [Paenibacillus mesotrionivorans]|uniref:DUF4238 domain-containing protein n=1 Tax=Paenibacillus mesotrionivorans TaxID=3160968 RepID=A0ACC7NWG7_9BACL